MTFVLFFKHLITGALGIFLGVQILRFSNQMLLWFGAAELAEKYIPGGTVSMWKLLGIALVVGGILVIFGYTSFIGF